MLTIALASQCGLVRAAAAETVLLASDPWPPYVTGELGGKVTGGLAVDLINRIFERIDGVDVAIPMVPWNRALAEVEKGTKDGIPMLLKTEEREAYMVYTDPLVRSSSLIWYVRERIPDGVEWQRIDDLVRYRIGITRGYSYGEEMDAALNSGRYTVVAAASTSQLFKMLTKNRVDLALANDAVGYTLAAEHAPDGAIVPAPKAIEIEVHYMAFSKKSPAVRLIPQINRIIGELRAEGVMARIFGKPEP